MKLLLSSITICKNLGKHFNEAIEKVNRLDHAEQLLGPVELKKAVDFARKSPDDTQTIILKSRQAIIDGMPLPWEE